MAEVTKSRLREQLLAAFEDIALMQATGMDMQQRALEARRPLEEIWTMAELGEVPEFEIQARARRVS